jgi:sugar phosphate isomerase/epimerase
VITVNGTEQPLILASSTTLGTPSFRARAEVAAAAGFDALGLELLVYRRIMTDEGSSADMAAILRDNGLRVAELESVLGFAVSPDMIATPLRGGRSYTSPEDLAELCEAAQLFGATHLVAVGALHTSVLEDDAADRFALLCEKAAEHGLRVALEMHPLTNVPDIATALQIIRTAGHPAGGLDIDAWHHIRGANDPAMLRALQPQDIVLIQLSDGPATAADDYAQEMLHGRQIPGAGQFDLPGFLNGTLASGGSAPVSVEVISDSLGRLAPAHAAHLLARQTTTLLADHEARWLSPAGHPQKARKGEPDDGLRPGPYLYQLLPAPRQGGQCTAA